MRWVGQLVPCFVMALGTRVAAIAGISWCFELSWLWATFCWLWIELASLEASHFFLWKLWKAQPLFRTIILQRLSSMGTQPPHGPLVGLAGLLPVSGSPLGVGR